MIKPYYEKRTLGIQIFISENMNFPAHLHDDMEMLYVLSGSIQVTIMGNERIMTEKECAFVFPEQVHSYHTELYSKVLLVIFNSPAAGSFIHTIKKYCSPEPFLSAKAVPSDVHLAFKRLSRQTNCENIPLCSAWIQIILAYILPILSLTPVNQLEDMDLTSRMVHYIMEHFTEPLTLDALAKELHVNKYYLSHTFSSKLQMNFREYLNRIRLEYAMQLIASDKKSFLQVWEEAGFESQRSFNRIFKEETAMTPSQYRKLQVNR